MRGNGHLDLNQFHISVARIGQAEPKQRTSAASSLQKGFDNDALHGKGGLDSLQLRDEARSVLHAKEI
jgi:hypothetical protein